MEKEPILKLKKVTVYACHKCPKTFSHQNDLEKHRKIHIHMFSAYVSLERNALLKCRCCKLSFTNTRELRLHELIHVRQDAIKNRSNNKDYENKEKPYKCDACDARFVLESTKKSHSVVHAPFPHVCNCGIGYYTSRDLHAHQRLVHPKATTWKPKINYTGPKPKHEFSVQIYKEHSPESEPEFEGSDSEPDWEPVKPKKGIGPRLKAQLVMKTKSEQKLKQRIKKIKSETIPDSEVRLIDEFGAEMELIKNENNHYPCPKCDKTFLLKARVVRHYISHIKGRKFLCSQCPKRFKHPTLLENHILEIHTKNGPRNFICDFCDKGFVAKRNLTLHILDHTGIRPHACDVCNKTFREQAALYTHKKTHDEASKTFACQYCQKCFRNLSSVQLHERIHTGEKPYKCTYCVKAFSDPSAFGRHIRTHTGDKRYACEYCPMRFSDASGLIAHRRRHGSVDKKVKCDFCDLKTFTKNQMKKHMNSVHLKIKKFECNLCLYRSSYKKNLENHIAAVHEKIKDFECKRCPMRFSSKCNMKKHVLTIHTKPKKVYQCQCSMKFQFPHYLKRHIEYVHLGIKPRYECDECGQVCEKKKEIQHHILTYHGTPLYCYKCLEVFVSDYDLQKHKDSCGKKVKSKKTKYERKRKVSIDSVKLEFESDSDAL